MKMKKGFIIGLISFILIVWGFSLAYAEESIHVVVDGEKLAFDVAPMMIDNRVMVPLRAIFEAMEVEPTWHPLERRITAEKDYAKVMLQIDNKTATVSGRTINLDVPARLIDNRTLVPVRFISESLGARVDWHGSTQTVMINSSSKDTMVGITREAYITTLVDVLGWSLEEVEVVATTEEAIPSTEEEALVRTKVHLAIHQGVIEEDLDLKQYITKEEMRLIFIRAIGFEMSTDEERIATIHSNMEALDESSRVVAIIKNMVEKISQPVTDVNGIYAIQSYGQIDYMESFDAITFGWSELTENRKGDIAFTLEGSSFKIPEGAYEAVDKARDENVEANLMVFASNRNGLVATLLSDKDMQKNVIDDIVDTVDGVKRDGRQVAFDGVVIDFEDLQSADLAQGYNTFLMNLKNQLVEEEKKLYVMVQPRFYNKGYDYRTIGRIADRVILMLHDYDPRDITQVNPRGKNDIYAIETPVAPIENSYNKDFDVYHALEDITDPEVGIEDRSKIAIQVALTGVQWQQQGKEHGVITSSHPLLEQIKNRMDKEQTAETFSRYYSKKYEAPYLTYYDEEKAIHNMIWYEDRRSIKSKINLAKIFDVRGLSIWRLGIIPNYKDEREQKDYLDLWDYFNDMMTE